MIPSINFIILRNPFNPENRIIESRDYEANKSLHDYIGDLQGSWVISSNGKIIDQNELKLHYPNAGDAIAIAPKLHGGGNSNTTKNILRIVSSVALAAFTFGQGAWAIPQLLEGSKWLWVAQFGASVGGSLLINAVLPYSPPKQNGVGGAVDKRDVTPTYGIDGAKNTSREGIPFPLVFGRQRIAGNIIGNYTQLEGQVQYLHMLLNLGEGVIAGIDKNSIMLNDQPMSDLADQPQIEIYYGNEGQDTPKWFDNQITPYPVTIGSDLVDWQTWSTFTTSVNNDIDAMRLDFITNIFKIDSQGYEQVHVVGIEAQVRKEGTTGEWIDFSSNIKSSHAALGYVFDYVEDETTGLYDRFDPGNKTITKRKLGQQNMLVDEPAIYNESTGLYTTEYEYDENGDGSDPTDPSPTPIWKTRGVNVNAYGVPAGVKYDDAFSNENVSSPRNVIYDDRGSGGTGNYPTAFEYGELIVDGQVVGRYHDFHAYNERIIGFNDQGIESGPIKARNIYLHGSSSTQTGRFNFTSARFPKGRYEIRVKRSSPKSTEQTIHDDIKWSETNEVIYGSIAYNYTALMAIRIKVTDQINAIPNVTVEHLGMVIPVWNDAIKRWIPSAASGTYHGQKHYHLTGTEKTRWVDHPLTPNQHEQVGLSVGGQIGMPNHLNYVRPAHTLELPVDMSIYAGNGFYQHNNPAWIVLALLTTPRWGGGLDANRIDFWAFKEWADFCYQKNLKFTGAFDSVDNVWEVIVNVFRVGRATPIRIGTRYSVSVEMPKVPTMRFGQDNIVKNSLSVNWLNEEDRANELELTFFDKAHDYKRRTIKVYDKFALQRGIERRNAAITLIGIVDEEHAIREAIYTLNNNKLSQVVTFDAQLESLACTIGDVISVQHDMMEWGASGKIKSVIDNGDKTFTIKLDAPIDFKSDQLLWKMIRTVNVIHRGDFVQKERYGNRILLDGFYPETVGNINRIKIQCGPPLGKDYEVAVLGTFSQWNGSENEYGVVIDMNDTSLVDTGQLYLAKTYDTDVMTTTQVTPSSYLSPTDTLTTGVIEDTPEKYQGYVLGYDVFESKLFTVRALDLNHDSLTRKVTAIEYNELVFDDTSTDFTIDTPQLDRPLKAVHSVEIRDQAIHVDNERMKVRLTLTWQHEDARYQSALVKATVNGSNTHILGRHVNMAAINLNRGDYVVFEITPYTEFGQAGVFKRIWHEVKGEFSPIYPPINAAIQSISGGNIVSWSNTEHEKIAKNKIYIINEGTLIGDTPIENIPDLSVIPDSDILSASTLLDETKTNNYHDKIELNQQSGKRWYWVQSRTKLGLDSALVHAGNANIITDASYNLVSVYNLSISKPVKPAGGSYSNPIPDGNNWTLTPPQRDPNDYDSSIWVSTRNFCNYVILQEPIWKDAEVVSEPQTPSHTWTAFASDTIGTDFSLTYNPDLHTHVGYSYNNQIPTPSNDHTLYAWEIIVNESALLTPADKANIDLIPSISQRVSNTERDIDILTTDVDQNYYTKTEVDSSFVGTAKHQSPLGLLQSLNELVNDGFYYQGNGPSATVANGYPEEGKAGNVLVLTQGTGVTQTYHVYDTWRIYTRMRTNNLWSSWSIQYSEGYKPTPAEIGASSVGHDHDTEYFTQTQINTKLSTKANTADVYSKTAADALLADKADVTSVYTKSQSDALLAAKANSADVYSKTAADALLADKADTSALTAGLNTKLDKTANAVSASKLATARNIALTGDVTGTASFDGTANISISSTVANNSHTHLWANITDKPALYTKSEIDSTFSNYTTTANLTTLLADKASNADLATGLATKLDSTANAVSASKWATARTLTLSNGVVGSATFDGSSNIVMSVSVRSDSHHHDNDYVKQGGDSYSGTLHFSNQTAHLAGNILTTNINHQMSGAAATWSYNQINANSTNIPTGLTNNNNAVMSLSTGDSSRGHQLFFGSDGNIHVRHSDGTTWSTWSKLFSDRNKPTWGDVTGKPTLYTQAEINLLLADKANSVDVYTKAQADTLLSTKANSVDVYTKVQADTLLSSKSDTSHVHAYSEITGTPDVYLKTQTYNKTEIDTALGLKADQTALTSGLATKLDATANAVSASKWATARKLTLGGDLTGNVTFDGSANFTLSAQVGNNSHTHLWANITDKPSSFTPSAHTHNDLYYTETEIDNLIADYTTTTALNALLAGKSDTSHHHNSDYLGITANAVSASKWASARKLTLGGDLVGNVTFDGTANFTLSAQVNNNSHTHLWANITDKPSSFTPSSHTHDDRYFTETEINAKFSDYTTTTTLNTLLAGKLNATANAVSASKLATARTIALSGDVSGSASFDGTSNISITATVANDSHSHSGDALNSILIGASQDLDNYKTAGFYHQPLDVNANNGTNYPVPNAGSLQVVLSAGVTQIYRVYNSSHVYSRSFYSSTWTAWAQEYNEAHKPTPVEIGAATSGHNHNATYLGITANAVSASKLATARNIALTGDVTGTASFDGTSNISITATVGNNSHTHLWANITDKPSSFTPSAHNHNSLYYTETEIDTLIANYTTTTALTALLADKLDATAQAVDAALLQGKTKAEVIAEARTGLALSTHNHNSAYLGITANAVSASKWATSRTLTLGGDLSGSVTFDGSGNISLSGQVANNSHTHLWANITDKPSSFTPSAHTHDDRYYTETETDTLLAGKSNTNHHHNSTYLGISANAVSASKLATARTITFNGDVTGSYSFDGTANKAVTLTVGNDSHTHDGRYYTEAETNTLLAGKSDNHSHPYLPLAGGTMGESAEIKWVQNSDGAGIHFKNDSDADADSYLGFYTLDNAHEYFRWYHKNSGLTPDTEWMTLKSDGLRIQGHLVYHEGHQPSWSEVTGKPSLYNQTQIDGFLADKLDVTANAVSASKLATARTISLGGDATGSVSFDGTGNVTLTATVVNDSHTHDTRYYTKTQIDSTFGNYTTTTALNTLLAGKSDTSHNHNSTYLGISANAVSASKLATARNIALTGDVSGSASFNGTANISITATVADNSHNHTWGNVTGKPSSFTPSAGTVITPIFLGTTDLDTLLSHGVYYQNANANTSAARHYPENNAGALIIYEGAGVTQVYRVYNSSRVYSRSKYASSAWTAWVQEYNEDHKPTLSELGAAASSHTHLWAHITDKPSLYTTAQVDSLLSAKLNATANAVSASKWASARTITLGGDLTGNVSLDGSANVTLSAQVVNDSHTHDGRYFTESESNSLFAYKAGSLEQDFSVKKLHIKSGGTDSCFIGSTIDGSRTHFDVRVTDDAAGNDTFRWIFRPWNDTEDRVLMQIYPSDIGANKARVNIYGEMYAQDGTKRVFHEGHLPTWSEVSGKPSTFTPSSHTHDDRYYTETEMNTLLSGKSDTGHHHNSTYLGINANAVSASKLATARNIALTGDVTGNVNFDGSGNVSIATAVGNNSHTHLWANITDKPSVFYVHPTTPGNKHIPSGGQSGDVMMWTSSGTSQWTNLNVAANVLYVWVVYSSAFDGSADFSATYDPLVHLYKGRAYNKPTPTQSNDPTDYDWTFIATEDLKTTVDALPTTYLGINANAVSASKLATARTISLGGDATGSISFDGTANKTLTVNVINDSHTHDGRYYTESETNTLLNAKLNANANAVSASKLATARTITFNGDVSGSYSFDGTANKTVTLAVGNDSHSHSWNNITGKPSTFAPSAHNHNDIYYTESEVNTLLSAKSDNHSHPYLPLAGGTLTGEAVIEWSLNTDGAGIHFKNIGDSDADSYLGFFTRDNSDEYFKWYHKPSGAEPSGYIEWMSLKSDGLRIGGDLVFHEGHHPTWGEVAGKPSTFTPSSHTHDDRYFTESEINTKLAAKLNTNANAVSASKLATARNIALTGDVTGNVNFDGTGNVSITTAVGNDSHTHHWNNVQGKPSSFTPSSHTHDDRYFTESEINTKLAAKLNTNANAVSASKLATARTITFTGDATGSFSFDGTANKTATLTVGNDSHTHSYNNLTNKPSSFPPSGHNHDVVLATDDRDVKPNTSGISATVKATKAFFVQSAELGFSDSGTYSDLFILDTYSDASGGQPNALAFGKAGNKKIYHLRPSFDATTWGDAHAVFTEANLPTWAQVSGKPSTFTPSSHTHDDRYYTETEVNNLLAGKLNTNANAVSASKLATARTITFTGDATGSFSFDGTVNRSVALTVGNDSHSHSWGNITGKPSSFNPSSHTHDDRYYTESESNARYAYKAGSVDQDFSVRKLNLKAGSSDSAYIDTTISGSATYLDFVFTDDHNQDKFRWLTTSSGDSAERVLMELYHSALGDNKARLNIKGEIYAQDGSKRVFHEGHHPTWGEVAGKPSSFTPSSHTHDDRYYTESETNTLLNAKLNTNANAVSASKLATARTITFNGDVSGSYSFDGTVNKTVTLAVGNDSHTHHWNNVQGKPSSFNPSSHTHDDRYFTESEINTKLADWSVANNVVESSITHIKTPKGAFFNSNTSNQTGAIKIVLPVSWTNTMLKFTVDVYEYLTDKSFSLEVGGYNYSSGWHNTHASIQGNIVNHTVRFCHDGAKCCIVIGDVGTVWQYPKLIVRDLIVGFSNSAIGTWDDGWSTALITTLPVNIDSTHSSAANVFSASKLATARTISLSGDATGSVSFDGSGNVTLPVTVNNGSHTHDDRYYTESESNSRFAYKAGSVDQQFSARGITLKAGSSDSASIDTEITGSSTFLDFNLSDDVNANDAFRWRFNTTGDSAERTKMMLYSTGTGANKARLNLYGEIYAQDGTKRVFHEGHHPTWSEVASKPTLVSPSGGGYADGEIAAWSNTSGTGLKTTNYGYSTGATANTFAVRDGSGDVNARLFRSNYGNQSTIAGAMAFRVNTSDNYIRFCSDTNSIRNFLGVASSSDTTRRRHINFGASGGNLRYCRLFEISKTDSHCTFTVTAQGDYGNRRRAWFQVSVGTRGSAIHLDIWSLNKANTSDPAVFYTRDNGSKFEVWMRSSDYNQNLDFVFMSQDNVTERFDNIGNTAPSSATTWGDNKIYHAGDKPTPADIGAAPSSHSHAWSEITSKPATFPPSSHTHATLSVADTRQLTPKPDDLSDRTMLSTFTNRDSPTASWVGKVTVKGYTDGYYAWELAASSSTSSDGKLYYRTGKGTKWDDWDTVLTQETYAENTGDIKFKKIFTSNTYYSVYAISTNGIGYIWGRNHYDVARINNGSGREIDHFQMIQLDYASYELVDIIPFVECVYFIMKKGNGKFIIFMNGYDNAGLNNSTTAGHQNKKMIVDDVDTYYPIENNSYSNDVAFYFVKDSANYVVGGRGHAKYADGVSNSGRVIRRVKKGSSHFNPVHGFYTIGSYYGRAFGSHASYGSPFLYACGLNEGGCCGVGHASSVTTFTVCKWDGMSESPGQKIVKVIGSDASHNGSGEYGHYWTMVLLEDGSIWHAGQGNWGVTGTGAYDTDNHIFTKIHSADSQRKIVDISCTGPEGFVSARYDTIYGPSYYVWGYDHFGYFGSAGYLPKTHLDTFKTHFLGSEVHLVCKQGAFYDIHRVPLIFYSEYTIGGWGQNIRGEFGRGDTQTATSSNMSQSINLPLSKGEKIIQCDYLAGNDGYMVIYALTNRGNLYASGTETYSVMLTTRGHSYGTTFRKLN